MKRRRNLVGFAVKGPRAGRDPPLLLAFDFAQYRFVLGGAK